MTKRLWWYSRILFLLVALCVVFDLGPKPAGVRAEACNTGQACQRYAGGYGCICYDTVECTGCFIPNGGGSACGHCATSGEIQ